MGLQIRMCRRGDEERMARFHEEARGRGSGPKFWKWKYFDNPAGASCVALALDGERVVGRLGFIPVKAQVQSREVMAAQQVDSDILPEYRRGGTFFHLARAVEREAQHRDLVFGFGFATEETSRISVDALGFRLIAPIGRLVKVLDYAHYFSRRLGISTPGPIRRGTRGLIKWREERRGRGEIHLSVVRRFDERFDQLWKDAARGPIMIVRETAYLNWRYVECPTVSYRVLGAEKGGALKGFIVLRARTVDGVTLGIIDDFVCVPHEPDVAETLIAGATTNLMDQGAVNVVCWLPNGHPFRQLFRKRGFRSRPIPNYLIVALYEGHDLRPDLLSDEKSWSYTLGDSDYHLNPGE